jgi:lysylphosphatidylglycerol synthetase-like protein (DUF2156 family)
LRVGGRKSMSGIPIEVRLQLLRRYGSFTQAYSSIYQSGLEHFGDEHGIVTYKMVGATAMVLSDPLAPRQKLGELISRFIREKQDVCFWQVSRPVAELLAPLKFFVNEMGHDTLIDLTKYSFEGTERRKLRLAVNRMERLGCVIKECSLALLDLNEVKALSDTWRSSRTIRKNEVAFLSRPVVLDDEVDVRKFFMFDRSGKMVALGFFDPLYDDGNVVGYVTSFKRRLPDADLLAGHAINHHAIKTFQREGRLWLTLGLAPLAGIKDEDFRYNWWVRKTFRRCYKNPLFNRFVYSLQGHALHKRQFGGAMQQTYFAYDRGFGLRHLAKLLRACDIV